MNRLESDMVHTI